MAENRAPTTITCSGCDTTWTGTAKCHCGRCHRTFAGLKWFDRHRSHGSCADPATIRDKHGRILMREQDGIWRDAQDWNADGLFRDAS